MMGLPRNPLNGHKKPHKFDPEHIDRLNDPKRLELLDVDKICDTLDLDQADILVEVGTGTGLFAEAFLKRLPRSVCYGLDISEPLVRWIEKNRSDFLEGRLKTRLMGESQVPLPENFADFVFMITLHHELEDPVVLLKECLLGAC